MLIADRGITSCCKGQGLDAPAIPIIIPDIIQRLPARPHFGRTLGFMVTPFQTVFRFLNPCHHVRHMRLGAFSTGLNISFLINLARSMLHEKDLCSDLRRSALPWTPSSVLTEEVSAMAGIIPICTNVRSVTPNAHIRTIPHWVVDVDTCAKRKTTRNRSYSLYSCIYTLHIQ